MKCNANQNWCGEHEIVYSEDDNHYCVFHAPKDKKGISNEDFNKLVFQLIDKNRKKKDVLLLKGTIFPDAISFEQYNYDNQISIDINFSEAHFHNEVSFHGTHFTGGAYFDHATFHANAHLDNVNFNAMTTFTGAQFKQEVHFDDSNFMNNAVFCDTIFNNKADFKNAIFTDSVDFSSSHFKNGVKFKKAEFKSDCHFSKSHFSGKIDFSSINSNPIYFSNATFHKASFVNPNMSQHIYNGANFGGSSLMNLDLSNTDLQNSKGIIFDNTYIKNAKISRNARDPWSILRRNYSGTLLIFHLVLLIAFIMPYFGKTLLWVGINQSQESLTRSVESIRIRAENINSNEAREFVLGELSKITPCLAPECKEHTVAEVIIGLDKESKIWILVVLLIVYNIFRTILTRFIGPLCDEESRHYTTPPLGSYNPFSEGYKKLLPLHHMSQVLFLVSIVTFLWHAWVWSTAILWLPVK